jgi:hypothetical protein
MTDDWPEYGTLMAPCNYADNTWATRQGHVYDADLLGEWRNT